MCGILGQASSRVAVSLEALGQCRDRMAHRGPDASGLWLEEDRSVGFAHRRLAVIDLSEKGIQPMADIDDLLTITFNGEIYNFVELRANLEKLGHRFRTRTDTEVILEAYKEWGADSVEKLNGMFAFAIYDRSKRRIFAARDRAGEKPLFYACAGGTFSFASELKALIHLPGIERGLDFDALNAFLAYGYVPGSMCMFSRISKLQQGEALIYEIETDCLKRWTYWTLPEIDCQKVHGPIEDLAHRLEALLEDSVRLRLIADVPVGILLSGGLDSSLITALACRTSSHQVHTFTVTFPGHSGYDESRHAKLVSNHFGTRHRELSPPQGSVDLPLLAKQFDEPIADSSMVPMYVISRLIREHATVAIGGDGGDELFGGYCSVSVLQQMNAVRRCLPGQLKRRVGHFASHHVPMGFWGRSYLRWVGMAEPDATVSMGAIYDLEVRRQLLGEGVLSAITLEAPERYRRHLVPDVGSIVGRATRMDFRSYLVDDILVKVDRASMLASLEVRAPFLDPALIDFAFRLPDHLRATAFSRKVLLRALGKRLLPQAFDLKRKQGFGIPLAAWLKSGWNEQWKEILDGADTQIFSRKAIQSLLSGQAHGYNNEHRLFALVMFELWRREYLCPRN